MLQRTVEELDRVWKRRKLEVNVGKSEVMASEEAREQTVDLQRHPKLEMRGWEAP